MNPKTPITPGHPAQPTPAARPPGSPAKASRPKASPAARTALRTKLTIAGVLACWIGFLAFGVLGLFLGGGTTSDLSAPRAESIGRNDFATGSQGVERRAELEAATKIYVAQHKDAPAPMVRGEELAPPAFLNEQLAKSGAHYRVRSVKGREAALYDIAG